MATLVRHRDSEVTRKGWFAFVQLGAPVVQTHGGGDAWPADPPFRVPGSPDAVRSSEQLPSEPGAKPVEYEKREVT
jgi:hypothetical protein